MPLAGRITKYGLISHVQGPIRIEFDEPFAHDCKNYHASFNIVEHVFELLDPSPRLKPGLVISIYI